MTEEGGGGIICVTVDTDHIWKYKNKIHFTFETWLFSEINRKGPVMEVCGMPHIVL